MSAAGEKERPAEVLVWTARLDDRNPEGARLPSPLSPDEAARAARFVFERDRLRFTFGRTVLRTILGDCLGTDPARIVFSYGPDGKPELPGSGLSFNMSGSGGRFIYALTRGPRIGVDIEGVHLPAEWERIAERFFTPDERAVLRTAGGGDRAGSFTRIWTRKEAVVKGIGRGLRLPLHLIDTAGEAGGSGRRVKFEAPADREGGWSVHDLEEFDGFASAVAIEYRGDVSFVERTFSLPFIGTKAGREDT